MAVRQLVSGLFGTLVSWVAAAAATEAHLMRPTSHIEGTGDGWPVLVFAFALTIPVGIALTAELVWRAGSRGAGGRAGAWVGALAGYVLFGAAAIGLLSLPLDQHHAYLIRDSINCSIPVIAFLTPTLGAVAGDRLRGARKA